MDDRFKFRAWHKPTKRMFKVWSFIPKHIFEDTPDGSTYMGNFDDCVLEQCTGIKDKNGKLIYEGDIVKVDEDFFQVKWNNYRYQYAAAWKGGPYEFFDELEILAANRCEGEVVGNIHENPGLMEEK